MVKVSLSLANIQFSVVGEPECTFRLVLPIKPVNPFVLSLGYNADHRLDSFLLCLRIHHRDPAPSQEPLHCVISCDNLVVRQIRVDWLLEVLFVYGMVEHFTPGGTRMHGSALRLRCRLTNVVHLLDPWTVLATTNREFNFEYVESRGTRTGHGC